MLKLYLKSMADTFRSKLKVSDKINAQEFPEKIDEVYEKGILHGQEDFWRMFTNNGERKSYYYAFFDADFSGETIPEGLCRPRLKNSSFRAMDRMFSSYKGTTIPKGIDCSSIDLRTSIGAQVFYQSSYLTEIYDMGICSADNMTGWYGYCYALKKIEKIRVDENTMYSTTFQQTTELQDVTFEGIIGQNLTMSDCKKLTRASLLNIISCLKDYSSDTSGTTHDLIIGTTNLAKLSDDERKQIEDKGWVVK